MMNAMIRHLLAVVRCFEVFALAVAGFVLTMLALVAVTLVLPYPLAAKAIRSLANLNRRQAADWSGVAIDRPAEPEIPVPSQRADGWYVHDKQLYKSPRVPRFLLRMQALGKDPTYTREWIYLFFEPFSGALTAVLAPALLALGVLVASGTTTFGLGSLDAGPLRWATGIALILLGVAVGPFLLRLNALWTRLLLAPPERSWFHTSGVASWIRERSRATWRAGGLAGLSLAAFGGFLLNLVAILLSWGGLLPYTATMTRPLVQLYRRTAREWTDEELPSPYRPFPQPPVRDADGSYRVGRSLHSDRASAIRAQRHGWMLRDAGTWRDLLWSAVGPLWAVIMLVPAVLVSVGFYGLVWQPLWWAPWAVPIGLTTGTWVTPFYLWYVPRLLFPASAAIPDWVSVPIGLVITVAGLLLALPILRLRGWWDRLLLNPTTSARLAQRVEHLTESRAEAVDAQAAELRRIERDLHDGAQARLVSVGLSLAAIERLMQTDPERARTLIAQARESSATALTELRDLVRGIHPPVLAERGLGDAVRAVALDSPLPVDVSVDMAGRVEPAVETAAYFAVCEALTNAARHANAHRVDVDIRHHEGVLVITVTDDGRGGADPDAGSGLRGVQRRLGTFDGVLAVRSPRGGPTVLTMEVPCALSSLKTSTS